MLKDISLPLLFWFVSIMASGQPNNLQTPDCDAQFMAFPDNQNPMKIHFRDQSLGLIVSWQWSFGDGSTAAIPDPDHIYTSGGTYFVCLTIYTNSGICHDVLCKAITVHQPGTCVADYHYSSSSGNILEFHFEDRSSGPVNRWHWNFGDGTTSEQRNPYHVFPAQGNYAVCLTAWKSDSMAFCQDTKCDTIRIFAQAPCKASFVTELDSMNQQPRVFKFASTSTGNPNQFEWRFGDDTGATGMPQVQHQYKYPGTYKVCLLVMKKSGGTTWCTDSICQTVKVPEYFNLGGHLFTGIAPINNPVSTGDTGIAYLFKYRGTGVVPFDTSFFTYLGYYAFPNLLPGDYLVKAELTPGSLHYSGFMPAYFPEVMTWSQSVQLVITDSSEYQSHISLPEVPVMVPGNGIIKGTVFMGEPGVGSLPEPHAKVLLFNDQLAPLGFSCPDYFGTFSFEGLPLGLYYLYAEKTGKYSRYSAVWLDENRPHQDSVFLGVFDYDVTGTNENSGMCPFFFQVYPNPSAGKFFVKISHPSKGTVQIRFSDMTGRVLLNTFVSQVPGETVTEIDAAKFRQGIYLVTVADEKGNLVTKKIVRL